MQLAPITLFVYNRPQFTRRTLESLHANELAAESELFVYADGPKADANTLQQTRINEVRQILREKNWCKKVTIIESPVNKGLASSVIHGVEQTLNRFGKVIVIEDDVEVSPYFLRFMNEALEKYEHVPKVQAVGSWNYYYHPEDPDTFFIHLPDTIAWATWKRSWDNFESDSQRIYNQLKERKLVDAFNLGGRFHYEEMLKLQIEGKVSSWAIRWTATALLHDTLCLYPSRSLSKHIGFGADSTHVKSADYNADLKLADSPIMLTDIPLINNQAAIDAFIHFEKVIRPLKTSKKKYLLHLAKNLLKGRWSEI